MAEKKEKVYCGHLAGTDQHLVCTGEKTCSKCCLDPYFKAIYEKGYKEGNADYENAKKNFQSTISNMERLQKQFTVHDMRGNAVSIKNTDFDMAAEKRRTTVITLKSGKKVKCQEPVEIVQALVNGTYDCY